jgi:hypothetical protein
VEASSDNSEGRDAAAAAAGDDTVDMEEREDTMCNG